MGFEEMNRYLIEKMTAIGIRYRFGDARPRDVVDQAVRCAPCTPQPPAICAPAR
jgi:hypothetical protein